MTDKRAASLQIAASTGHDPRTVLSALEGKPVRLATLKAVEAAAAQLGITLPSKAA